MRKYILLLFSIILLSFNSFTQEITGEKIYCAPVIKSTNVELMQHWSNYWPPEFKKRNSGLGLEEPNRKILPQAPGAKELSQWPNLANKTEMYANAPQTQGTTFTGATLPDAGAFPPDVMGAVGPTQFVVFINGRLRTFNKSTGVADGVIDADTDAFFSLVTTTPGVGEITFTSDPNVRYDRLSGRWFLTIVDVTLSGGSISRPNRLLFAWSDGSNITGSTVWSFTYYQNPTFFDDYPSLGIDADGLYIGTNKFTVAGAFSNVKAYVLNKASIIAGTPSGSIFDNLLVSNAGPFAPRGVDNYDPNNTGPTAVGYFIGVDNATFGTLMIRRVTNPGGTPTMSANISVATMISTSFPVKVPHLGNTGGNNGRLDALDDRLYAAHLRNGRLWTAHNIGVNNSGTTISPRTRNAARWYELQNLSTTPTVVQSGTLYDDSGTAGDSNQRNYWIPSIMVSGQGHVVLGCSIAGTNERINAFTTGRLSGDALGTLRDGPGGTTFPGYTSSSTAYNPPSDPGGIGGRRWGDYSYTSLDPDNDMTIWTAQEFCSSTNTWGVQVVQLLAPLPVTPTLSTPSAVGPNEVSVNVIITGTVVNGSGFFDPGAGFPNHISASLPGGIVVNSVTYDSPTQVTLNLNTTGVADGYYTVTITNPDGQSATSASGILQVDSAVPVELSSFTAKVLGNGNVKLDWRTESEVNNYGFEVQRSEFDIQGGPNWKKIVFVEGHGNSNSPNEYSFMDDGISYGVYLYRLKQIDNDGTYEYSNEIEIDAGKIPNDFILEQNYPNPFNPSTTIRFALNESVPASLKIYDALGNEIAELFDAQAVAGKIYDLEFNGKNLSSGIYFYKLETPSRTIHRKMLLIK